LVCFRADPDGVVFRFVGIFSQAGKFVDPDGRVLVDSQHRSLGSLRRTTPKCEKFRFFMCRALYGTRNPDSGFGPSLRKSLDHMGPTSPLGGEEDDEDYVLEKIAPKVERTKEFDQFSELTKDRKLKRLNDLVSHSLKFSELIAENLVKDSTVDKEKPVKMGEISTANQPALLENCVLKDYQLDGMRWLVSLYENGLNGILADEMGLGKTLETISLFVFLYEQNIKGKFLIVCPLSTVDNWCNELARFAPVLDTMCYIGPPPVRSKLRKKLRQKSVNVVVTSFEMSIRDRKYLEKISWEYLVVDEGHRLKNTNCLLIRELKKLKTNNRLLLTGTPLQNNLKELWSLLNFILPSIFHDVDMFQQWFDFSSLDELKADNNDQELNEVINEEIQKSLITSLHTILKPFLLRRLKKDVIKGLPSKREYIVYSKLTPAQEVLYKAALKNQLKDKLLRIGFREYLKCNKIKGFTTSEVTTFLDKVMNDEVTSLGRAKTGNSNPNQEAELIDLLGSDSEDDIGHDNEDKSFYSSLPSNSKRRRLTRSQDAKYNESSRGKQKIAIDEKLNEYWSIVRSQILKKKLSNLVMQLRLICDSPFLFFDPWEDDQPLDFKKIVRESSKMQMLAQLLPRLLDSKKSPDGKKHKVLIFCQFTKMMDLVEMWCQEENYSTYRIDGTTSQEERAGMVKGFATKDIDIFLLSTRSGGLGINLTASDTVILFDSDWNPQVDLQAIDRVHRIGQTQPVIIYRLCNINTIEQVLLARADSKRRLERLVISMGKFSTLSRLAGSNQSDSADLGKKDSLAHELAQFLLTTSLRNSNQEQLVDNNLTALELDEMLDRSEQAYLKADRDSENLHPHISLFETVSGLDR